MREYPQAVEIEKKLLSAMMLKNGAAVPKVAEIVAAEDFYRQEHKLIFNAIFVNYSPRTDSETISVIGNTLQGFDVADRRLSCETINSVTNSVDRFSVQFGKKFQCTFGIFYNHNVYPLENIYK